MPSTAETAPCWCPRACSDAADGAAHGDAPAWAMVLAQHHNAAGPCAPGVPLCSRLVPCFLPSMCLCLPVHTGSCVLHGDTDPCQSQLGEINTPGLKELRARGGGGSGWYPRAPCPALPALHGTPCARAACGLCHPGTAWCQAEQGSGAWLAVLHHQGCGAETAPPTRGAPTHRSR